MSLYDFDPKVILLSGKENVEYVPEKNPYSLVTNLTFNSDQEFYNSFKIVQTATKVIYKNCTFNNPFSNGAPIFNDLKT
jgi:hypothetical protein